MKRLKNIFFRNKIKKNNQKLASKRLNKTIALVNQYFPPDYAATGQLLDDLTQRIATENLNFLVFTGQPSYSYDIKDAPHRERDGSRLILRSNTSRIFPRTIKGKTINSFIFSINFIFKLIRESFGSKIDLFIFTTEPPFMTFLAYLVFLIFRKPFIFILYDLYPDILVSTKTLSVDSFLIKFWRFINQIVYEKSDNLIVLSEPMKSKILQTYKNLDEDKISIIYSWIDAKKIKPIPKKDNFFVNENDLGNKFVVLYSGNFGRCHDVETIQECVNNLKNNNDILFLFIGSGPRLPSLKKYCKENNLFNVTFLPSQPLSVLPYSLASGDLALVTQLGNTDGIIAPSKLYGHLATSTPIAGVSSSRSYLNKIICKNKFGKCFKNGDSKGLSEWIIYLKNNPSEKLKLGNNARTFLLETATPEIITKRYLSIINKSI